YIYCKYTIYHPTLLSFPTRRSSDLQDRPLNKYQVEVIFPTALPIEVIKSLFTLSEVDDLPSLSFKRMFITFNETYSMLQINFLSDRKSTRLNSSHVSISYAVFCLKK